MPQVSSCLSESSARGRRRAARRAALSASLAAAAASLLLSGCSVVHINGSWRTKNDSICVIRPAVVEPAVHGTLVKLLAKKGFKVTELKHGAAPEACQQTILYTWAREQYYLPTWVTQYAINLDLFVAGEKVANASFDPTRNLSPHVKYVRFSRYLARTLDRLFPGRPLIGA